MSNSFTYGKATNIGRLRQEILDNPGITTICDYLSGVSGIATASVTINFLTDLSTAEETVLSGIVSDHIPLPPVAAISLLDQHENKLQVLTSVSGLFGTEYQKVSFDNETSTTDDDYATVVALTTTSLVGGVYRIGWKWEGKIDNESTRNSYQVRLDDSVNLAKHGNGSQNDRWAASAGWQTEMLGSGVHTIEIQSRRSAGGSTVTTRNLHIELWRVL